DNKSSEHCRLLPVFKDLGVPHKQVHDLAREAALAIEHDDKAKAGKLMETMANASQEVVDILKELQREC
ncbi:MAG: chemotaxis protein, partial [Bacillota bacterium]|nr:chemotaxis protein [Bacillota bacterium]